MKRSINSPTNGIDTARAAGDRTNTRLKYFNKHLVTPKCDHSETGRRISLLVEILKATSSRSHSRIGKIGRQILKGKRVIGRGCVREDKYLAVSIFDSEVLDTGLADSLRGSQQANALG